MILENFENTSIILIFCLEFSQNIKIRNFTMNLALEILN